MNPFLLREASLWLPANTAFLSSRGFQMSTMYGRTEEVFGKSYDKGHHVCHGAGGGLTGTSFLNCAR